MTTDYALLGLPESAPPAAVKRAFRARMKALHPDTAPPGDAFKNHLLFIEICKAYERLVAAGGASAARSPAGAIHPPAPASVNPAPAAGSGAAGATAIARHSDPAYVFYKNGMRFFMQIHPSAWNLETRRRLNTKIPGHGAENEKIRIQVEKISSLFPRAYYYFKIVFHEYPDSPWARDAEVKMRQIEDRTVRYRKIITSFS